MLLEQFKHRVSGRDWAPISLMTFFLKPTCMTLPQNFGNKKLAMFKNSCKLNWKSVNQIFANKENASLKYSSPQQYGQPFWVQFLLAWNVMISRPQHNLPECWTLWLILSGYVMSKFVTNFHIFKQTFCIFTSMYAIDVATLHDSAQGHYFLFLIQAEIEKLLLTHFILNFNLCTAGN